MDDPIDGIVQNMSASEAADVEHRAREQRDELLAALELALPILRTEYLQLAEKYAGTKFEQDPAYLSVKTRYENAKAAIAKVKGSAT